MAVRRYTAHELYHLRTSPLVQKPDNLPAIEQWIDDAAQQQQQQPSQQSTASKKPQRPGLTASASLGDGSPMGSFSTGQRPGLSRPVTSRNGEDISLGPPRTMFPSSRNVPRLADFQDRTGSATTPAESAHVEDAESARSRFFADRQQNRRTATEKEGRDTRDSWTSIRERRALGVDSDDHGREKNDRHGRHDKDQDGERRNGYGDRHDARWGSSRDDKRNNGERTGGWRDREQQRRDRDGDRGHIEKDPEWMMEDAVVKKDAELGMGMARTQEDFQKWKESMGKPKKDMDKDEPLEPEIMQQTVPREPEVKPAANVAPLNLEGFNLSGWGANNNANPSTSTTPAPVSKPGPKAKASRFASMFKPVEVPATPAEQVVTPPAVPVKASAEDKVGFDRVLQMLGSTKIAPPSNLNNEQAPASPTANKTGSNGRPKSRFTDLFEARSPERLQSPPDEANPLREESINSSIGRRMDEPNHAGVFESMQMPRAMNTKHGYGSNVNMASETPGIPFNALREQQPQQSRPASGRINDFGPMFDPPARGTATPDNNIQNLLAQQRQQRPAFDSNGSQQLLNLLKTDASRTVDKPNDSHLQGPQNFLPELYQRYVHENKSPAEPHAPKPRMPHQPPGFFEEQLMRNSAQQQPEQQQHQQQQHQQLLLQQMQDNAQAQRRLGQRAPAGAAPPPGFYDEHQILLQQQQQQLRRNFEAQQQQHQPAQHFQQHQPQSSQGGSVSVRRMSGVPHLPPHMQMLPQQLPPQQFHGGPPPPLGTEFGGGPPPPGFNPHMVRHHPPGFHSLPGGMFPQQQPHPQQQNSRSDQLPSPAGFPPQQQGGMPPPPGFYGMPGPLPGPHHAQQQQQQRGGGGNGFGVQMMPPGINGGEPPGRR